jgi:MFS transporter, DHA1 family, multidrug resistance protein
VWGFGAAAPRSLALAMVRDSYEGDRMARAMSHVMTVFILVPVFAPLLGALAVALGPWRIVFWIPVLGAGILSLWLFRLPETLPPERRRSVSPKALGDALAAVVRTRETMAYGIAVTLLFAIMTSFIGGAQTIFEKVYDAKDLFPLLFGLIACMLGVGSLLSGRLVLRFGLYRLLRGASLYLVTAAVGLTLLVTATDGHPPLWSFCVGLGLLLPGVMMLVPSCNTAAMTPVPEVAGMATAVLGTISTAGGALLGSVVDGAFDNTVRPFALAALTYAVLAAFAILVLARVPDRAPRELIVLPEAAAG